MNDTLFLRLSGPMQSWGTGSKLQIRRTDPYPSKSGVLGLLLCAMGVDRDSAPRALEPLAALQMGVRIDRPGELDWDYHTAGAGIGIRKAKGGVKKTDTTGELETLLSRRQYILDASFLVALHGEREVTQQAAEALQKPAWPIFLGRKCCVPTEPVFAGTAEHRSLKAALESMPFFTDRLSDPGSKETLDAILEHVPGTPPPDGAQLVYDVPRTLRHPSHGPRWVVRTTVQAPRIACLTVNRIRDVRARVDYASDQWKEVRARRLDFDGGLCVFCKSPAEEVHHVTYENAGKESIEDLRSLCHICHDACTQLEYGGGMTRHRMDPADPSQRDLMLTQIDRLVRGRRLGRRRAILEGTRQMATDFLSDAPGQNAEG